MGHGDGTSTSGQRPSAESGSTANGTGLRIEGARCLGASRIGGSFELPPILLSIKILSEGGGTFRNGLAPEIAGVAEQFDFGGDADGEEREGDHGNGETREAFRERDAGAGGTSKKAAGDRRTVAEDGGFRFAAVDCAVAGRTALVDGYGNPTALAGPHEVEVLLRSCHFFLLYFL